jgi:hypothetical protein
MSRIYCPYSKISTNIFMCLYIYKLYDNDNSVDGVSTTSLNCGDERAYCSFIPQGMENHSGMMLTEENWFVHQSALWQCYQQSNLVANHYDLGEESDEFCLRNISFILVEFFNMPYNLTTGADGFTSLPKEGVLRILIAFKNPSPRLGF